MCLRKAWIWLSVLLAVALVWLMLTRFWFPGPEADARDGEEHVLQPVRRHVDKELRQPHGGLVFCADLIPGRPWVHVPITMGYDRNAELLIDEKRAFLEDKLARNVHLFFTHDPACALAQVVRDANGRFGTAHEVAELQARLGHSTVAAALRYQHAAQGRDAEIAAKLSDLARPPQE